MPRKISIVRKREWLKAYEEGRSEASIASKEHCDVRTLKKGIREARLERDATMARAELMKDALRNHNEMLLEVIRGILLVVRVPGIDEFVPWKSESTEDSIRIEGGKVQYENWPELKVTYITLDIEGKTEWGLLEEHLKLDRLWRLLSQWKKTLTSLIEARIVMRQKLANLIREKTGYQIVDKPADNAFLYSESVGFLFKKILEQLQENNDLTYLEKNIIVESDSGNIIFGGLIMGKAPGGEQVCKKAISDAISELQGSTEMINVITTYRVAEELTAKTRQAAEELLMLGLVPGECRICRRLGR